MDRAVRQRVLEETFIGMRVAEDEGDSLYKYFLETELWTKLYDGTIDIVYGPKGSGKSALYTHLFQKQQELLSRRVIAIRAEELRGDPVFRAVSTDPPTTELEFTSLWKLYIITLCMNRLVEHLKGDSDIDYVKKVLHHNGIEINGERSLADSIGATIRFVKRAISNTSLTPELTIDQSTGNPTLGLRLSLSEDSSSNLASDAITLNALIRRVCASIVRNQWQVWIGLDRLDLVFGENVQLETAALRALFRCYRTFEGFGGIKLKVFLRDDIWSRITQQGFREASHITKSEVIQWDELSLVNLLVRRLVTGDSFCSAMGLDPAAVLGSVELQRKAFHSFYPSILVTLLSKNSMAASYWIMTRLADGKGVVNPREFIQLAQQSRTRQLSLYRMGDGVGSHESLLHQRAVFDSFPSISKDKFERAILAEYPDLRMYLLALQSQRIDLGTINTFKQIWGLDEIESRSAADRLVDIGVLSVRNLSVTGSLSRAYRVAPIYLPALDMSWQ